MTREVGTQITRSRATSFGLCGLAALALLLVGAAAAWADHPGGAVRSAGWSPLTAALIFGGLALLAGMLVVVIIALIMRRGS
jgi:ABC-type phosphate transport system permease subunit